MTTETVSLGLTKATYGSEVGVWDAFERQDRDRLEARLATPFAGDPNGSVAGYWLGQLVYNSSASFPYICTASGSASTAVWTRLDTNINALGNINALAALTAPAIDDLFAIWDLSASGNRSISLANHMKVIAGLTAMTASDIDLANDIVLIYDASASDIRRGNPNHLLGLGKLIGRATYTTAATFALTAASDVIPIDDTVPENIEGIEILSGNYTASATTTPLRISADIPIFGAAVTYVAAIFGSASLALAAALSSPGSAGTSGQILRVVYEGFATATTAITYSIRTSRDPTGNTLYINSNTANRLLGGVQSVKLTIEEFKL